MDKTMYGVIDTETGELWATPKGKCVWPKRNHAANAWNVRQPWRSPKFSEQKRFKTVVVKLVVVTECEYD